MYTILIDKICSLVIIGLADVAVHHLSDSIYHFSISLNAPKIWNNFPLEQHSIPVGCILTALNQISAEGSQGIKFGQVSSFCHEMSLLGMPVQ